MEHHPAGFSRFPFLYRCLAVVMEARRAPHSPPSNGATIGSRLHEATNMADLGGLSSFQRVAVERCLEYELEKEKELAEHAGMTLDAAGEVTLPITKEGKEITFGTLDKLIVFEKGVLIIDWKFHPAGFVNEDVKWQLIGQGVAALQAYEKANAAVCVAYAPYGPTEYEIYITRNDLPHYVKAVSEMVEAAMADNPKHNPGPWCEHCPGVAGCEQTRIAAEQTALAIRSNGMPILREANGAIEIDDDANALFWKRIKHAETVIDKAKKAWTRCNLAAMDAGWESKYLTIRESGKTAKISDYDKAWDQVPEEAVHHLRAAVLRKWGLKELAGALKKVDPSLSDARARKQAEDCLADNLQWSTKTPSIQKRKGVEI